GFLFNAPRENAFDSREKQKAAREKNTLRHSVTMPEGYSRFSSEPAPSHRPWASARARPLADLDASNNLLRQTVVAISLHDATALAGCGDGHLRGAFGAVGERHDLLAKLVIVGLRSQFRQRLLHIRRLDLPPVGCDHRRRRASPGEP